jgi:hypothetical protein
VGRDHFIGMYVSPVLVQLVRDAVAHPPAAAARRDRLPAAHPDHAP